MEMNKFKAAERIFEKIILSHKNYAEAYTEHLRIELPQIPENIGQNQQEG
jgi:hypothetical protein